MVCLSILPASSEQKEMMPFDLDEFIVDGENFFEDSAYQYQRSFADFHDSNDESVFFSQYSSDTSVIYAPDDTELIRKLIGHKGYNFINITERSDVDKIWHNQNNNTIEITGGEHKNRMFHYYIKGLKMKNRKLPENMYYFNKQPFFVPSHICENY